MYFTRCGKFVPDKGIIAEHLYYEAENEDRRNEFTNEPRQNKRAGAALKSHTCPVYEGLFNSLSACFILFQKIF